MSVTLVEQIIAGGPLPTGVGYAYSRCTSLNMWYAFRIHATTGLIQYQQLPVFPPTAFNNADEAWVDTAKYINTPDKLSQWIVIPQHKTELNIVSYCVNGPTHASPDDSTLCGGDLTVNTGNASASNRVTNGAVAAVHGFGTDDAYSMYPRWAAVLGKKITGQPHYYIHVSGVVSPSVVLTVPIDSSKCIVVDNKVECYGVYIHDASVQSSPGVFTSQAYKTYALLSPAGIMVEITIVHSGGSSTVTATNYYQLTVPAGGTIRQFLNGYYIATDVSNNVFLYSINSNGTLITQLLGTYSPSLAIELLAIY